MKSIMRVLELDTLEVSYLSGHNEQDAKDSFGIDIKITKMLAIDAKYEDVLEGIFDVQPVSNNSVRPAQG